VKTTENKVSGNNVTVIYGTDSSVRMIRADKITYTPDDNEIVYTPDENDITYTKPDPDEIVIDI
jgi:hypothetical protein